MLSKLEKRRELLSLRESMQCSEVEKLVLPLTAKLQQVMSPGIKHQVMPRSTLQWNGKGEHNPQRGNPEAEGETVEQV
jgi:hypothetical protein